MSNKSEMNTQPFLPVAARKTNPTTQPVSEMQTQGWQRPLPETSAPSPQSRRRTWPRLARLAVILLFVVMSVVLALGGILILYQVDWIVPGVSVAGFDVGQRTQAEAATMLQENWDSKVILLELDGSQQSAIPTDLGLVLDAEQTAVRARQQGRTFASWQGFVEHNGRFLLSPVWQYEQGQATAGLAAVAAEFALAPVEAELVWQNGRFQAISGQPGRELDIAASEIALGQQAEDVLANGRFEPVTRVIQPKVPDLSEVAAEANSLLAVPLAVRAYDPVTDETVLQMISPETWGTWLRIEKMDEPFTWSLDDVALANYRQALVLGEGRFVDSEAWQTAVTQAITNHEPQVNLRIYHEPQTHVVASGETLASIGRAYGIPYPWVQQANPGLGSLNPGQSIVIPSPDDMLPLPIVAHKRIIVSISQQKAWVYEHGRLKWEWLASTGIPSSPTAPGVFQIQTHEANAYAGNWDLWMPSFMGIYRPVPTSDFMNGFHGFPTRGGSTLLWTGDLGHPVTYGCILLSSENAKLLFDWAEAGVIVEIQA
ncbi:MAG: hypothetical protein CSA11_08925 [Chloroflexi bacterium]|nr:MAG: hypothetical protein CSA11_08925 [Chloroflexota bacterium]